MLWMIRHQKKHQQTFKAINLWGRLGQEKIIEQADWLLQEGWPWAIAMRSAQPQPATALCTGLGTVVAYHDPNFADAAGIDEFLLAVFKHWKIPPEHAVEAAKSILDARRRA